MAFNKEHIFFGGKFWLDFGMVLTGFESFLLRPVGKVGILKEDLNFKGEFFENLN